MARGQPAAKKSQELDMIDELDESNPLGIALHHDGPYEAIQKAIKPRERVPRVSHKVTSSKIPRLHFPSRSEPHDSPTGNLSQFMISPFVLMFLLISLLVKSCHIRWLLITGLSRLWVLPPMFTIGRPWVARALRNVLLLLTGQRGRS